MIATIAMFAITAFVFMASSKEVKAETTTFNLEWTGTSSPTSAALVSKDNYDSSKTLKVGFTMKGEAFIGTAYMSGVPYNYTLRSGEASVRYPIDYNNLGIYVIMNINPAASYDGQTVKCNLALLGVSGCYLYSYGNIGY